jgi:hypothetical protein
MKSLWLTAKARTFDGRHAHGQRTGAPGISLRAAAEIVFGPASPRRMASYEQAEDSDQQNGQHGR